MVDGVPLVELDIDAWREQVVYLSQSPTFDPTSTVREALSAMLPRATVDAHARALEKLGFSDYEAVLNRALGTLSAGQRRRVQLARALAAERHVLILDEPEAGLDAATEKSVREHLLELAKTRLLILATHSESYGEGCMLDPVAAVGSGSRSQP